MDSSKPLKPTGFFAEVISERLQDGDISQAIAANIKHLISIAPFPNAEPVTTYEAAEDRVDQLIDVMGVSQMNNGERLMARRLVAECPTLAARAAEGKTRPEFELLLTRGMQLAKGKLNPGQLKSMLERRLARLKL